ncbi:MAG: porin family protein [Alphaproteobacteria bacterium]|nr:porin family protein [Alphaproteobacteria bacterium]
MKNIKIATIALTIGVVGTAAANAAPANVTYGQMANAPRATQTTTTQTPQQMSPRTAATTENNRVYIGANIGWNILTFNNKYSLASDPTTETDRFSFESALGFDVAVGWQFNNKWRAELNYVYAGNYEDKDTLTTFELQRQYLALNGIYTFKSWTRTSFYGGLGIGVGQLRTSWTGAYFAPEAKNDKDSTTFVAHGILGLEERLVDNLHLNLAYKLSFMTGHEHDVLLNGGDTFKSKTSGIIGNTFSLGIRYVF